MFSSAIEDMTYLDNSFRLLQPYKSQPKDGSSQGVLKPSLAKRLAESGLANNNLKHLHQIHGEKGLLAALINPPSSAKDAGVRLTRRPRGTTDVVSLNKIVAHFKDY